MTREEIRDVVLATLKELGLADRALARIQLDTIITKS